MNWDYKTALNEYKPTIEEHIALKKLKPTLNALIQYADDMCLTEVSIRTLGRDLNKRPNTVSEHIRELEQLGFVKVIQKSGKFGSTYIRKLTLPTVSVTVPITETITVSVNETVTETVTVSAKTDNKEKRREEKELLNVPLSSTDPKDFFYDASKQPTPEMENAIILSDYLEEMILKNQPTARIGNKKTWSNDIEKMIRIDKREPEDIQKCIEWIFIGTSKNSIFWQPNIRSGKKLREHYDKMLAQAIKE